MASKVGGQLVPFAHFLKFFDSEGHAAYRRQVEDALKSLCQAGGQTSKGFDPARLDKLLVILARTVMEPTPPEFSSSQLQQISRRARDFAVTVRKLRLSSFIIAATWAGLIPPGDILYVEIGNPEDVQARFPPVFNTVIDLPALAKRYRSEVLRGTDGHLKDLCSYVKKTTGRWHDAEVIAVLQPFGIRHAETEEALKMWRSRVMKR